MKLGVYSVCLPDLTPHQAIAAAADAGYAGIEWRIGHDVGSAAEPHFLTNNRCTVRPEPAAVQSVADQCAAAGLDVIALNPYLTVGDLAGVEEIMSIASSVGVPRIRLRAPALGDRGFQHTLRQAREFFADVAELAGRYGVQALLEMHQRTICPSASLTHRVVGELPPDRVGVIYDAGNLVLEGYEDHDLALQILGPHLAHVHIKNAGYHRPQDGGPWQLRWTPMDDGVLDVPRVLQLLEKIGYQGWVSVEDLSTDRTSIDALTFNAHYLRQYATFDTTSTATDLTTEGAQR